MISKTNDHSPSNRHGPTRRRPVAFLALSALWLLLSLVNHPRSALAWPAQPALQEVEHGIGEPASHLRCEPGYSATYYARGLRGPDGLAFGPSGAPQDGALYVAEERAGRVSRIEPDGRITPILGGLRNPEGIAFDDAGNLYITEDARDGRLIRRSPDGEVVTLADGLAAPEDVVVVPGQGEGAAPTVYVIESNVQYVRNPFDLQTGIAAVTSPGSITRVIAHTPTAHWNASGATVAFWSYSGLAWGPDGRLYVTNELSGIKVTRQVTLFSNVFTFRVTLWTDDSVFAIDPARGKRTLVASGLFSPEGLSFSADGDFPLYVAEENIGSGGRISRVERNGRQTTVCSGFRSLEDVVVDADGHLYASEDDAGNIIRIEVSHAADGAPGLTAPRETPASGWPSARFPGVGRLRGLWQRLAPFVRRIAAVFRPTRTADLRPTAVPSAVQYPATPPLPGPPLQPGARVIVRNTGGQNLRCRAQPGLDAEIVGRLPEGAITTLESGPVQQDGHLWWQVELPDEMPCWAAGDWLIPLNDLD